MLESIVDGILAALSLVAFVLCGLDKARAGMGRRRIPEASLLTWAALGGSPGLLLGMLVFRHKVRKGGFLGRLFVVVAIQLAAVLLSAHFLL